MIGPHVALAVMVIYLLMLFGIAQYADRQKHLGKSIVANPYVYALSLCVYVSAWTFYGSIGRAASTGLEFLPIYLGPVLAMAIGWIVIRKMIRVSKENRLTSVSDFISFRYGRSFAIGAIVAVFCLIMVTPYVALQLIAISTSLEILSGPYTFLGLTVESKLLVALLLGAFAAIFGARHLDPMERHEGLIAVVAFESIVKIVAFLIVGVYVTYGIFGGYGIIMNETASLTSSDIEYADLLDMEYSLWFTLTLISFFAVFFLPRQFHVMVVENSEESHLKKAMWIFPLYLLLINIFVPAIAAGGLLLKTSGLKDAFIITIPYVQGQDWLALLVFIGGTSAATAMILVESVAVGTMILNDLEMPYILKHIKKERSLANALLNARRLNILLVVFLGYLYSRAVAYQILSEIGVVSFLAASQLAPVAFGGLYWKKGNRKGALAGLVSGFLLWGYTALIPTVAGENYILGRLVQDGPFGLAFLKPTNLFGLDLDIWTNSVLWTLLINTSLYILVSLLSKPSPEEEAIAVNFVNVFQEKAEPWRLKREEMRQGTIEELEGTLARYIGETQARDKVDAVLARLGTSRETIEKPQLQELWNQFEKTLTGSLGPSATRMIVKDQITVKPVIEAAEATLPTYVLEKGKIYVIPEKAYEVFTDQITHGVEGLCITYRDPEEVRKIWGFKETPIIKLSDERGSDHYISPRNLPLLFMTIKSFADSSKNSIVLMDSIERLMKENHGIDKERDMLDFVYQMELLGQKTHLILAERPQFINISMPLVINEVKELLFTLGPFSVNLFKIFSDAMLIRLGEKERKEAVMEANELIEGQSFFETTKSEPISDDASAAACDQDMKYALPTGLSPEIWSCSPLTRRNFFMAIRKLSRIIKKYDSSFDLTATLAELMQNYGRSPLEITLIPGTTYVVMEEKPQRSLEVFSELVSHGMDGLCISRYNPEILRERYGVPAKTVIWLTQKSEPEYRTVDPTNFPRLNSIISDFLGKANYPIILMEGIGYLITQNNYETVLRFIQSQRDENALTNAIMLVHIDPLSLDTKELHRLASEMETFKI